MKPLKLTMSAFGSYAEATVDFTRFTGGLYLIVGKTGSGKTTIFDAICFALFGVASGSERSADMLHSDFISKSTDTLVALDFLQQGRSFHLERRIHFRKKRGTENEHGEGMPDALLLEQDREPIQGAVRVTNRCTELLGLNAEQFRRIVMLAQGEFREFLRSGSDKKSEILGRLFDSAEYVRYQNLLCAARDNLSRRRAARERELQTLMELVFRMPESEESSCREAYLPGHPRLTENLRALIDREQHQLEGLQAELARQQAAADQLTGRYAVARTDNDLFRRMDEAKQHLDALIRLGPETEAARSVYRSAEPAWHRVQPRLMELSRAKADLEKTEAEIAELEAAAARQRADLSAAQAAVEADREAKEAVRRLDAAESALRESLPRYADLEARQKELRDVSEDLTSVSLRLEELRARQEAADRESKNRRTEIETLEDAEAACVRLREEGKVLRDRWDRFFDKAEGIEAQTAGLMARQAALAGKADGLQVLTDRAAAAEQTHHSLYSAFLAGQAGLLAAAAQKTLAENGRAVCPVCGTVFLRGDHPRFCVPAEQIPSQSEVDAAAREADRAEKERRDAVARQDKERSLLLQQQDALVCQVARLAPECADWETLSGPVFLPSLRTDLDRRLREKRRDYLTQSDRKTRREQLQAAEKEAAALSESLAEESRTCTARREELSGRGQSLTTAIREISRQLTYPDADAARRQLNAMAEQRTGLQTPILAHEDALRTAEGRCAETSGALQAHRAALPKLRQALDGAEAALAEVLSATGFADADAARSALLPMQGQDPERWLQAQKLALDDYDRDLTGTQERIAELEEQTRDKQPQELDCLAAELQAAKAAAEKAAAAAGAHRNLLDNHMQVLQSVAAARQELDGTEQAHRRLSRLAELALGANSDGGRLSFDRYVMGTIFREVLEMANRRLDVMTGGRFELVHSTDAGRRNASAGLEIEIRDVARGTLRSSASVSGGEGFMVSLALALGLSDVVQSHAGGQKLDTLFIDEGFGSLDDGKLDNVITVLQQLTEGNRLVGIISHVDKLEESIPQKLRVRSTDRGSIILPELS